MAKITGPVKTWRLHRRTDIKQRQLEEWKVYRKGAGKKAMGLALWLKEGRKKGKLKRVKRTVKPTEHKKKIAYYGQGRETADAKLRRIKRGK